MTTGIFNSIVLILSLFINIGSLVKIMKLRKSGNLANVSKAKLEMGLFLIVVWMMCTLVVLIIFQVKMHQKYIIINYFIGHTFHSSQWANQPNWGCPNKICHLHCLPSAALGGRFGLGQPPLGHYFDERNYPECGIALS